MQMSHRDRMQINWYVQVNNKFSTKSRVKFNPEIQFEFETTIKDIQVYLNSLPVSVAVSGNKIFFINRRQLQSKNKHTTSSSNNTISRGSFENPSNRITACQCFFAVTGYRRTKQSRVRETY